jgi:hypothetical protein
MAGEIVAENKGFDYKRGEEFARNHEELTVAAS